MDIVLASTSPYRKELLERLRIPFKAQNPNLHEGPFKERIHDPLVLTKTLAFEKARSLLLQFPQSLIIGADQIALFEGEILGKPKERKKAFAQIKKLQGRTHQLITSVCLLGPQEFKEEFSDITELTMRPLSQEEIDRYLCLDQPLNCAGSYKIESLGISLFQKIQTQDATAIMGLPLIQLSKVLREVGLPCP